ncbi:hypothetical protein TCEL_02185 [Thermobrachium celere DSM 8682]|uniref:Uncharacterized protein n=1 Tax=Thermobrachium celere DSM 8682 TaxID=941824 RepID=R7RSF9_9CLOT|nr:hypothetical protein TCEL_02185 [Thermobrachium celere DSM 8682]
MYGTEEVLVGSALVKNDLNETIARATLDAINRVIQKITYLKLNILVKKADLIYILSLAEKCDR